MEKITTAYANFPTDKELLRKLIQTQFLLTEAEEKELPSVDLESECLNLKMQILNKLGKEKAQEVKNILTNCGNLVRKELEGDYGRWKRLSKKKG